MKIEITKKQEIINDVVKESEYKIGITQHFGTGELKYHHSQSLYNLDLGDIELLRNKLNEMFPITN